MFSINPYLSDNCSFKTFTMNVRSRFICYCLCNRFELIVFVSVGGTMGAVITCPLEVVKTRLQASAIHYRRHVQMNATHWRPSSVFYTPEMHWNLFYHQQCPLNSRIIIFQDTLLPWTHKRGLLSCLRYVNLKALIISSLTIVLTSPRQTCGWAGRVSSFVQRPRCEHNRRCTDTCHILLYLFYSQKEIQSNFYSRFPQRTRVFCWICRWDSYLALRLVSKEFGTSGMGL